MQDILMIRNPYKTQPGVYPYDAKESALIRRIQQEIPGFAPTPLRILTGLAQRLGVKDVLVKDESARFGLNAFKGLGGVYAMFRVLCERLDLDPETTTLEQIRSSREVAGLTFITTTDGNHGKGISFAAKCFGCRAVVKMPRQTVEVRAQAIRDAGNAEVEILDMDYDDCVRRCAVLAEENGWILIQDTSFPGYEKVPQWIMQGYSTILYEAAEQMGSRIPTHIFLQAGVGAMAGAETATATCIWPQRSMVISLVEPHAANCHFLSFQAGDGVPHASGTGDTLMAGLNCGEPCGISWKILKDCASFAFSCSDDITVRGMRRYASPEPGDPGVISGESGAVTLGVLEALFTEEYRPLREELELNADSVVLLINTEGDTDPENYHRMVFSSKA